MKLAPLHKDLATAFFSNLTAECSSQIHISLIKITNLLSNLQLFTERSYIYIF